MKHLLLYIVIVAAAVSIPLKRQDVAKLKPVELVSLYVQDEYVILETDTQDVGLGKTVRQAYENLEQTTAGVIYLDTAEYLLVTEDALELLPQMRGYLKENVSVCLQAQPVDPEMAAGYLAEQRKLPKLKTWKTGSSMPMLQEFQNRLIFLKKGENSA